MSSFGLFSLPSLLNRLDSNHLSSFFSSSYSGNLYYAYKVSKLKGVVPWDAESLKRNDVKFLGRKGAPEDEVTAKMLRLVCTSAARGFFSKCLYRIRVRISSYILVDSS